MTRITTILFDFVFLLPLFDEISSEAHTEKFYFEELL